MKYLLLLISFIINILSAEEFSLKHILAPKEIELKLQITLCMKI